MLNPEKVNELHKIEAIIDGKPTFFDHDAIFDSQVLGNNQTRLLIGLAESNWPFILNLIQCLEPPYRLLYVLHIRRNLPQARYESPSLSFGQLNAFLDKFGNFLSRDARHDFWIHSPSSQGTLVWDRHNLIFAYGPLEKFSDELQKGRFQRKLPEIDFHHAHHYHSEFDETVADLLSNLPWEPKPIQDSDLQPQEFEDQRPRFPGID